MRETRLTPIGGVHAISLFAEGEISLEALTALNFFLEMNEVRDKLVPISTVGMICLIGHVTILHNENNHVRMV